MDEDPQIVLASASPRRAELLRQIGIRFVVAPAEIDESRDKAESVEAHVTRLARTKAESVAARLETLGFEPHLVVLGADTVVALGDDVIAKPRDRPEARAAIRLLSGRWHVVLTAVAVVVNRAHGRDCGVSLSRSSVRFRSLSNVEVDAYCALGEAYDKAGAYGIQGVGGIFVDRIEGSYSGIMGLPLVEAEALLSAFGVNTWRYRGA